MRASPARAACGRPVGRAGVPQRGRGAARRRSRTGTRRTGTSRRPNRVRPNRPGDRVLPPPDVLPNNLPSQLSSFVGRERELDELKSVLQETRMLTLTGAGGSGKTRLAIALAAQSLGGYPDG